MAPDNDEREDDTEDADDERTGSVSECSVVSTGKNDQSARLAIVKPIAKKQPAASAKNFKRCMRGLYGPVPEKNRRYLCVCDTLANDAKTWKDAAACQYIRLRHRDRIDRIPVFVDGPQRADCGTGRRFVIADEPDVRPMRRGTDAFRLQWKRDRGKRQ